MFVSSAPSGFCMPPSSSSALEEAEFRGARLSGAAFVPPRPCCAACGRRGSEELCLASRGNPGALEELCIGCYLCEELQALGARLPEESPAYRVHVARLRVAYRALRCALATGPLEDPSSSGDASES